MEFAAIVALIEGVLQMAAKLGPQLAPLVDSAKTAITTLFNGGAITAEQKAALEAQVAAAEAAWALQVAQARSEV